MSLGHSPSIVRDGLVFYYDMGNAQKSWRGKPATNLCTTNLKDWNKYEYNTPANVSVSLTPNATLAPDGTTTGILYTPLAVAYIQYIWLYGLLSNAWHTFSIYVKYNGYRYAKFGSSTQNAVFDLLAGTWVTPGTSAVSVGNGWWRLSFACFVEGGYLHNFWSSNSSGGGGGYPAENITPVAGAGTYIWGAQIESGNFASSYTATSRSNTQALLDLTNTNTITASSLTYNSDGTFSFNGTSDYIDCGSFSAISENSPITLSAWIKFSASQSSKILIAKHTDTTGGSKGFGIGIDDTAANKIKFHMNTYSVRVNSTMTLNNNMWHLVVGTWDTTTLKLYIDGVLDATNGTATALTVPSVNLNIGRWVGGLSQYFNGSISAASIYNRALTAAEIQQNYNALKGRFGL